MEIPNSINFPQEEQKILQFWKQIDAFYQSCKLSKDRPVYSFYDGPPFATGLPHYGHLLAGTIKDTVTRWAYQNGYHVVRRFGWDCHGLPVEYEIDKTLGITSPSQVQEMGIKAYNDECRKIVMRYSSEWEQVVTRLGRWIDFKNDYKTMYPWFMESVWWVFKQLFDKGFVYQGYKVMPFSTACHTPLSNFEANQNYKTVDDPAVIVNFPLDDDPNTNMIAWTTTPWTLPSNLALCVNAALPYVKVRDKSNDLVYIMMQSRLGSLFHSEEEYEVLEEMLGSSLEGLGYKPLFPYFGDLKEKGAFRVLCDDYVTEESGTGVVHQAPYFGEDDFRVCLANVVISREMNPVCPVDDAGVFMEPVTDFAGLYVKDADKKIVKQLKELGRVVSLSTVSHSYPFCWRSETPLIYKAVPSMFVRVEPIVDQLLANNQKTYWVPDFVKEKRFANWLRDARDWAISRKRYWGTPIPLWVSDDGQEWKCVGSIAELEELSGKKVTDLHRENVDPIKIPSLSGKGFLTRVPEVFDCWFESGSMPYAQQHYPFENRRRFEESFPADFIAEGIDQTRGWFYTLLVLSTQLFGKPPFKNLIVNGLVLARDGKKMSKRLRNYSDPMSIVEEHGADALRLYLITSPAVRGESLRFLNEGVRDMVKDVFIPWFNAFKFLLQNVDSYGDAFRMVADFKPVNFMDRWLVSYIQSLISFIRKEMGAYRLFTVAPELLKFVDQLTNWYVRMNRLRLKGDTDPDDHMAALQTLTHVLFTMTKVMAPFIPFLTEYMYQKLKRCASGVEQSVHFEMIPDVRRDLVDKEVEKAVTTMQTVVELGRVIRDRKTLPLKTPLREVVVIHRDAAVLNNAKLLEGYILQELNVRTLTTCSDKTTYGVQLKATLNFRELGSRLKGDMKKVTAEVKMLTDEELMECEKRGSITLCGHELSASRDLHLGYAVGNNGAAQSHYEAHFSQDNILVLLDVSPDEELQNEGIAREVVNRIQKLRKKASLQPKDAIEVYWKASGPLGSIMESFNGLMVQTVKKPLKPYPPPAEKPIIISEASKVKQETLELTIVGAGNVAIPFCPYLNVSFAANGVQNVGVVLLENPKSENVLTRDQLENSIAKVFPNPMKWFCFSDPKRTTKIGNDIPVNAATVYAGQEGVPSTESHKVPVCSFVNLVSENGDKTATVLLENPKGYPISRQQLRELTRTLFHLKHFNLLENGAQVSTDSLIDLHGKVLTVVAHL